MSNLPADYLERVYAGVLGKLIGVYLGSKKVCTRDPLQLSSAESSIKHEPYLIARTRCLHVVGPFEGWTHQQVLEKLGHVRDYVHEKMDVPVPLVVTDDDVSGTFTFLRALEEHGVSPDLKAEEVGKTWLNHIIDRRTILWWGGIGISTEQTAYFNLKHGIPAPHSGSIKTNGKTIAEQIGAQIFVDGWALVAPGNPDLAAKFAEAAGTVSHDGESVYAAKLWAAMEAEAFVSKDVDHLLDEGLRHIPGNSLIATIIGEIRQWVQEDGDWLKTRQRIEDKYGYEKFSGICHVIPNHAIMIMTILYAGHDFHEAMHIINTCGWDTDCNSGNVGCLVALINGLSCFEGGVDWRGPLADRALISSADTGYSFNNAVRLTYDIVNFGRRLAGEEPLPAPKDGAQFHFSLPGGVQGFQTTSPEVVKVEQGRNGKHESALAAHISGLSKAAESVEILTQTFSPLEIKKMKTYDMVGSPLVYPGQTVKAALQADATNSAPATVCLRLKVYSPDSSLVTHDGEAVVLRPGEANILEWTIPDAFASQPIQSLGIAVSATEDQLDGTIWMDYLRWDGTPQFTLKRSTDEWGANEFWRSAFAQSVDTFRSYGKSFRVAHDRGEGVIIYGTREWKDYRVVAHNFILNIGGPNGLCIRMQGLNRYYALLFTENGLSLVKALDEKRTELARADFSWEVDVPYKVILEAEGDEIRASVSEATITARDPRYEGGGFGIVVHSGSVSADYVDIGPLR